MPNARIGVIAKVRFGSGADRRLRVASGHCSETAKLLGKAGVGRARVLDHPGQP